MEEPPDEPTIVDSARKHGIEDEDMLHAYRNPTTLYDLDDGLTMWIGPAYSAQLLEVGVVDSDDGPVIVHAMKAREKFLHRR